MSENIQKLKQKYKGEWLAIEVTKKTEQGPVEGILIARGSDRDEIWAKAPASKGKLIYVIFSGPPLKEGYAACFK